MYWKSCHGIETPENGGIINDGKYSFRRNKPYQANAISFFDEVYQII